MLGSRKLIIDTRSEIYGMIKDRADGIFWNFEQHVQKNELVPGAVYVIGREQACIHAPLIHNLVKSNTILVVYSNPTEGSEPMEHNLIKYGYIEPIKLKKVIVVTGGEINPTYTHLLYENFLTKIHDYNENIQAIEEYATEQQSSRPYKFLFLNGRMRHHRKYLLFYFRDAGLLDQALWTNLDSGIGVGPIATRIENPGDIINLPIPGQDITKLLLNETFPMQYLPAEYEVDRYRKQITSYTDNPQARVDLPIKKHLFQNEWGEVYLNSKTYLDTYFSIVTETVFSLNRSFRTEKIWKPIAIGHPFIVASNRGYYRDLQNLGFRTFGHLIDESFDTIDNPQDRIERIAAVTKDLCQQDLPAFVTAAGEVCKYNQQLLEELRPKVRAEFPERFFQFINRHFNE